MTTCVKTTDVQKKWWLIDAKGAVTGRLASTIAILLRGKHKACFTPNMDNGDHVVVINAGKVTFTGNKMKDKKHYWHTGYIGGLKQISMRDRLNGKTPYKVLEDAVKNMLPKGPLGYKMFGNLHVYNDEHHAHHAQQPASYDFIARNRKNRG